MNGMRGPDFVDKCAFVSLCRFVACLIVFDDSLKTLSENAIRRVDNEFNVNEHRDKYHTFACVFVIACLTNRACNCSRCDESAHIVAASVECRSIESTLE